MSILFLFLSLYIGISIHFSLVTGIIEIILLIAFLIYRTNWKFAAICFGVALLGFGISYIKPTSNRDVYQSVVIEVKDNYYITSCSLEKFYISEQNHNHEVGDILLLEGYKKELDFNIIESGFDFKDYLNRKGVYIEFIVTHLSYKFQTPIKVHEVKKNFLSKFDANTAALVGSILFGNNIEAESTNTFRNLHLFRLISNSGIFLYLIFFCINFLLSYLIKDKYSNIITILLLIGYSFFTYPRFVVIKFIIMKIIVWINKYFLKNKFTYLELISGLGIFFLLFDYNLAFQDSFFLAFFIPIFSLFINGSFRSIKKIKKRILLSFLIVVSFVPFTLKYNNELSPFSFPLQFLLIPLTSIYGLISMLCFLGIPLYSGLNGFTGFLVGMLNKISPILFKIYAPPMSGIATLAFELVLIFVIYFVSIKFKEISKILIPISLLSLIVYVLPIETAIKPKVTFINVGQGDSCLITYKSDSILIDTGGSKYKDYATECLIPFFKRQKIYNIDLLITTHDDVDHSGAVESLINNFKVQNYISDYKSFPVTIGNITINNLNIYPELWSDDNDSSLVLYFTVKDFNFLIMGDAPKKIENQIVNDLNHLDIDILKVGHHGSNTSTSEKFISKYHPSEAVISCGKNNRYGHPHQETLNVLFKYGVKVRRTDLEGSIIYSL